MKNNPGLKELPHSFHRNFLINLGKNLMKPKPAELPVLSTENIENQPPAKRRRVVCEICTGAKLRTREKCGLCKKYACKNHSKSACTNCINKR